jgi:hypothetical protein
MEVWDLEVLAGLYNRLREVKGKVMEAKRVTVREATVDGELTAVPLPTHRKILRILSLHNE